MGCRLALIRDVQQRIVLYVHVNLSHTLKKGKLSVVFLIDRKSSSNIFLKDKIAPEGQAVRSLERKSPCNTLSQIRIFFMKSY